VRRQRGRMPSIAHKKNLKKWARGTVASLAPGWSRRHCHRPSRSLAVVSSNDFVLPIRPCSVRSPSSPSTKVQEGVSRNTSTSDLPGSRGRLTQLLPSRRHDTAVELWPYNRQMQRWMLIARGLCSFWENVAGLRWRTRRSLSSRTAVNGRGERESFGCPGARMNELAPRGLTVRHLGGGVRSWRSEPTGLLFAMRFS
jgi:hypothetical protein